MGGSTLYDTDVLAWSREQAAALRDVARAPAPGSNRVDWDNVIEEIETVGCNELNAVESHLFNIFVHLLMIRADTGADPVAHWRGEVATFHAAFARTSSPSMRQRVGLELEWRRARRVACERLAAYGRTIVLADDTCPYSLDDFLVEAIDIDALVGRIRML